LAAASGDFETPPVSAITGDPVRPWKSMVTAVSARTGALRSMEIVACTWRGLSGLSCRPDTSPTRMPLNSTVPPVRRPDTEPSNSTRKKARSPLPPMF
jgi:hypothetical protein